MKHNRLNLGTLCASIAVAAIIFLYNFTAAFAQQSPNVLEVNAQFNFAQVKVGTTKCLPMLATNTTNSSLIISGLHFITGSDFFTLTDTTHFPLELTVGQSLVIGNLCFASKAPNKEFIGYIKVDYSPQSQSSNGEIRIAALTEVDSSSLLPCYSVAFDSALFGPVFYGGQSVRTMFVTNNLDTVRTIRCIDFTIGDNTAFAGTNNHFPLQIPPHATRQIHVMFMPLGPAKDGSDNFRSKVKIEAMDGGDVCAPDYDIYGTAIKPTDMNTMNPFDRSSILPTLRMSGTDSIFGQTFLFASTDKDSLLIKAISLDSQYAFFTLEPLNACSNLPMTVAPGDYLAVRISLAASSSVLYRNKLRFVLGNGMAPIVFNVEAMRVMPQDAVSTNLPQSPSFTFSTIPNPSSGNIAIQISGAAKADIEIFDAIGKLVTLEKDITSWIWNGRSLGGSRVPSGNYLIRATSRDNSGTVLVETKQVSIVR